MPLLHKIAWFVSWLVILLAASDIKRIKVGFKTTMLHASSAVQFLKQITGFYVICYESYVIDSHSKSIFKQY
jgi:hypothetical protein